MDNIEQIKTDLNISRRLFGMGIDMLAEFDRIQKLEAQLEALTGEKLPPPGPAPKLPLAFG